MLKTVVAVLAAGLVLAGCKTTEQAATAVRAKWIGQPVDRFFMENGPPVSSYALDSGGIIYTWRGGEMSYVRPAQYQTRPAFGASPMRTTERTTVMTAHPSPGVTVTRSRTTSSSFGFSAPSVTTMVQPAQQVNLVCEAQITADDKGRIVAVRISRDTEGAALSFSRCADIFGGEE
ncbi:hypothetical protein GGR34_000409 [Microvirga flocculans]|uniref:Lipoprotein n=1 Tax=Microvirga flocculans TaxID=217168 RepID=A0A7W6ICB3_9HYPH|nr:hypothetical protein [Microvirga flocculans]MBB4038780.1 hypothetical protein [Microvirga flocculans]